METWDAARARRNVRQYTDRPIAREDLFGQATACMMLTVADLGIGSGHSADRPLRPLLRPARRPFDEVVHRDRW